MILKKLWWSFVFIPSVIVPITTTAQTKSCQHSATEAAGVQFKPHCELHGEFLPLQGVDHYVHWGMFDIFTVGYYGAPQNNLVATQASVPKCLEIYYHREVSAELFQEITIEGILDNISNDSFQKIEPQVNAYNNLYQSVKEGDRYRIEYLPEQGTTLYLNDNILGTVTGDAFSSALYSIWIGQSPITSEQKCNLLNCHCPYHHEETD